MKRDLDNQNGVAKTKRLTSATKNILLMGFVSLFMDLSTEMVYPILPLFLVSLGSTPMIIGIIEGIAEGLAALLKSVSGFISDKYRSRKLLVTVGYSASLFYKIGLLLSTSWIGVLISRIVDKTGKGLRTAPRDSIVAENGGSNMGKGFGLHKMLDMLGSALGVLLAYLILFFDYEYKTIIIISAIPALVSVSLLFFVKEKRSQNTLDLSAAPKVKRSLKDIKLPKSVVLYLCTMFIFSIGNSSNAFLLLRAQECGFGSQNVILLYLLYNVAASVLSLPFGKLSDKLGRKKIVLPSYLLYCAVYLGFAFATNQISFIVLFAVYGVYTALISGSEKAMLAELAPAEYKGTVLGLAGTAQGVGLIISSFTAGTLWEVYGSKTALIFGAAMSAVAAVTVLFLRVNKKASVVQSEAPDADI